MIAEAVMESYYKFLGVDLEAFKQGKRIFKSKYRDLLVNKIATQQIILTRFNDALIMSVSPEVYDSYDEFFKNGIVEAVGSNNRAKCVLLMQDFATKNFLNYSYRTMERFVRSTEIEEAVAVGDDTIELLSEKHYDNYWKAAQNEDAERLSKYEFDKIWENKSQIIKDERQYIALNDEKVVSYCKVSDVVENMANLVVYTSEYKRNHGYGKKVVSKMVNDCIKKDLIPIYWVSVDNYHSKALVKSLAFNSLAKEDVISFD